MILIYNYPFTAPAVSPDINALLEKKNKITNGNDAITYAAYIGPLPLDGSVIILTIDTITGRTVSSAAQTKGQI